MIENRDLRQRAKFVVAISTLGLTAFAITCNVASLALTGAEAVDSAGFAILATAAGAVGTWFQHAQGKVDTEKAKNGRTHDVA